MEEIRGMHADPPRTSAYGYGTLSAMPQISLSRPCAPGPAGRDTRFDINWYSVGTTICLITIVTALFAEIFRIM